MLQSIKSQKGLFKQAEIRSQAQDYVVVNVRAEATAPLGSVNLHLSLAKDVENMKTAKAVRDVSYCDKGCPSTDKLLLDTEPNILANPDDFGFCKDYKHKNDY